MSTSLAVKTSPRPWFVLAAVLILIAGLVAAASPATAMTPPSEPRVLVASGLDSAVALKWRAPRRGSAAKIRGFQIRYSTDGGATWSTPVKRTQPRSTQTTIDGLANGTTYVFQVRAVKKAGKSRWSKKSTSVAPVPPQVQQPAPAPVQVVAPVSAVAPVTPTLVDPPAPQLDPTPSPTAGTASPTPSPTSTRTRSPQPTTSPTATPKPTPTPTASKSARHRHRHRHPHPPPPPPRNAVDPTAAAAHPGGSMVGPREGHVLAVAAHGHHRHHGRRRRVRHRR